VVAGWGGAASSTHLAASGGRVLALDNVIGADGRPDRVSVAPRIHRSPAVTA
jgi:hypothetical protein